MHNDKQQAVSSAENYVYSDRAQGLSETRTHLKLQADFCAPGTTRPLNAIPRNLKLRKLTLERRVV